MLHSLKMFQVWAVTGLIAAALALASCTEPSKDTTLQTLADAFHRANQADTIEPMLELYHLEGVQDTTLTRLKGALKFELGIPIRSIEFEELSGAPEECIQFVHNDVKYGPSLPPSYRMRVIYDQEDGLTSLFTLGRNQAGQWKIVCARPIEASQESLSYTPAL